jgi:hypothetical protein
MVRYFVIPQKEEAFYSLIARFQEHLNMAISRLNATLFGHTNLKHNILLSSNLRTFCERIGNDFSLPYQKAHDNHTILPLLKKFNQKFIDFEDKKNPIKLFSNRYLSQQEFKFCPLCFEESYKLTGEPYWNRMHSIPYVQICLIHKVRLQRWSPSVTSMNKREVFPASLVDHKLDAKYEKSPLVHSLASQAIECFTNTFQPNLNDVIQLAREVGLLKKQGIMFKFNNDHHKALNEFVKEATLNSGQEAIEILKSIRLMLFKSANTINPYSYLTLLAYINSCVKIPTVKKEKKFEVDKVLLQERRNAWEKELNSVDFISLSISRIKLKTEYRWLLKKDPEWTTIINKKKRNRTFARTKRKPNITRTDNQIVEDIKKKKLFLIEDQLDRQISKQLLLHLPDFKFLTKGALELLPKTRTYIENNLETKFEFRKRSVTKFMIDSQTSLPRKWEVFEKFKINYSGKYSKDQQVQLREIVNRFY